MTLEDLVSAWKIVAALKDSGRITNDQYDARFERIAALAESAGLKKMFWENIALKDDGTYSHKGMLERGWRLSSKTGAWVRQSG